MNMQVFRVHAPSGARLPDSFWLSTVYGSVSEVAKEGGFVPFHSRSQSVNQEVLNPRRESRADNRIIQPWPHIVQRRTHFCSPPVSASVLHCPAPLPTSSKSVFDGFPSNLYGICVTHAHTRTQNTNSRKHTRCLCHTHPSHLHQLTLTISVI